jgi:hypothetical protein
MHSQTIVNDDKELSGIDHLLKEYERCYTFTERKNCLDNIQENLATIVTSGLGLDKILSFIKEPTLQKQILKTIRDVKCKQDSFIDIQDEALINIFLKKIHPDYQCEFARDSLNCRQIKKLLANDPTGDRFKLIIGKDNQVENLKKMLSFRDFRRLYQSPMEFRYRFSEIQKSEQITFIKDFIGIDNLLELISPVLILISILEVLAPDARYSFLINDLEITNFKKIMYDSYESSGFHHQIICELLPKEDFIFLYNILFTQEQQLARDKLSACRDVIENTNFITTVGACSDSLHGCVEIETKEGVKKFVSDTAKYILDTIDKHNYILSNHVNTLEKVQEICKRALAYEKINPQYKDGIMGNALKFAIWMTRTNEAMELYAMIAEDKIQPVQEQMEKNPGVLFEMYK